MGLLASNPRALISVAAKFSGLAAILELVAANPGLVVAILAANINFVL